MSGIISFWRIDYMWVPSVRKINNTGFGCVQNGLFISSPHILLKLLSY